MPSSVVNTYLAIAAVAEDDADGAKRAIDMSRWGSGSPLSLTERGEQLTSRTDSDNQKQTYCHGEMQSVVSGMKL